ncbi:DUF1308 domain-containing protein [Microbulbifer sp. CNSA002]|uniref:DUF1308 domain-containing protein n=1 Tax=Microbulbifer sp. CNSA002 TaxID=3373604 RepID=UPI0039B5C799
MALTATDSAAGAAARGILGRIGQALFGTPVGADVVAAIFPTQMGDGTRPLQGRLDAGGVLEEAGALEAIRSARGAVNLDTGTLRALSSGNAEVAVAIYAAIGDKHMLVTQAAFSELVSSVARDGNESTILAAAAVLSQTSLIPNLPSARVMSMQTTRSVGAMDKLIFGTGDALRVATFSSDAKFVRGAAS